ncbi:MAG: hypothetical protein IE909_00050 [Campylobacterales bacterium]|nr:hypothetical protein [Campylobacterales bacterium]
MQLYLYARSGHNFGLENVRRASALCYMLSECDPILCTADYRAATFAKANLDVSKGVGVDVIGNMPNIMERNDLLIYDDSNEASDIMQSHMKEFCKLLYKVGKDIPFNVVDPRFFEPSEKNETRTVFFADDDYADFFLNLLRTGSKKEYNLIWGHYFFFKNEKETASYFNEVIEEDGYIDTIKTSKYLLTASVHAAMESLASGNMPVFFVRKDKTPSNFDLIQKYNIPVIESDNFDDLCQKFEQTIANYPKINPIERFDIEPIKKEITDMLAKFAMIKPSLEYKF